MNKRKGFTLEELIVVVAIIGILSAVVVPDYLKYVENAKMTKLYTDAETIYNVVMNLAADKITKNETPSGYVLIGNDEFTKEVQALIGDDIVIFDYSPGSDMMNSWVISGNYNLYTNMYDVMVMAPYSSGGFYCWRNGVLMQ